MNIKITFRGSFEKFGTLPVTGEVLLAEYNWPSMWKINILLAVMLPQARYKSADGTAVGVGSIDETLNAAITEALINLKKEVQG